MNKNDNAAPNLPAEDGIRALSTIEKLSKYSDNPPLMQEVRAGDDTPLRPNWLSSTVSIFRGINKGTTPAEYITLGDWIERTQSEETRLQLEPIHAAANSGGDVTSLKMDLPVATPSAQFITRDKEVPFPERITNYNGIICADFDHAPGQTDRMTSADVEQYYRALQSLPYVAFCAQSASGRGLYAFCLTDNTDYHQHKTYWTALSYDIEERLGLVNDPQTKDVTRCRFLSYDPKPYINKMAIPFSLPTGFEVPQKEEKGEDMSFNKDQLEQDVASCVAEFERRSIVLGDSTYDTRYHLGTALKWLSSGLDYYKRICAGFNHSRTPEEEFSCFPEPSEPTKENPHPITLGSFFRIMKENWGITPSEDEYQFPLDGLVPWAREVIEDVAQAYQTPIDYVAAALFAAVAALSATKFVLFDGLHHNSPQLWVGLVGRDGAGKSDALSFFFDPIRDELDAPRDIIYKAELRAWEQAGDTTVPRPQHQRYVVGDVTPEQRDTLLYECGALAEVSDELAQFWGNLNRYAKSGEVGNLLSTFSNKGYAVDRKSEESFIVKRPIFSICGGLQPAIISRELGKTEFDGNGFRPRWVWAWPCHIGKRRHTPGELSPRTSKRWITVVHILDELEECVQLTLSPEAEKIYGEYCDNLEARAESMPGGESSAAWGIAAKMPIHLQRLALIVQIMDDTSGGVITASSMEYAIKCCEYFWITANKVEETISKKGLPTKGHRSSQDAIRGLAQAYPKLNQSELAKAIGVSQPYISKVLK